MERIVDGFEKEYKMIESLIDLCHVSHIDDFFDKNTKKNDDVKFNDNKPDN